MGEKKEKGDGASGREEEREGERERDGEILGRYLSSDDGPWRNGMRLWNFVLFVVLAVASCDFNRRNSKSPLVPAARVFHGDNSTVPWPGGGEGDNISAGGNHRPAERGRRTGRRRIRQKRRPLKNLSTLGSTFSSPAGGRLGSRSYPERSPSRKGGDSPSFGDSLPSDFFHRDDDHLPRTLGEVMF